MDVTISVRAAHSVSTVPERGTARLAVAFDGSDQQDVLERAMAAAERVRESLSGRYAPQTGPVVAVTADQVHTSAHRPHHDGGAQLPLVHAARLAMTATFNEVTELGRWVVEIMQIPGVAIDGVVWELTATTRQNVERDSRREAVRKAQRVAQDYSDALGLGHVNVREIDDRAHQHPRAARALASALPGDGSRTFDPEEIEVSTTVDVVFVVTRP